MTQINRLSSRSVDTKSEPGLHADGLNLYLRVGKGAAPSRQWVFVYQWQGRRREMGLGRAAGSNLAKARTAAAEARALLADGIDPIADRKAQTGSVTTFEQVARDLIDRMRPGWKNAKHGDQWWSTLKTHAASLLPMPVNQITTVDVLAVLRPIWTSKPETARRVRGRIENILDAAKAIGLRTGENPAAWRGNLVHLLPTQPKLVRGHQRALAFEKAPSFYSSLRKRDGVASKALALTVLTSVRTTEALHARWSEFDLEAKVWTIPAARTKTKSQLRVPLSDEALFVLAEVEGLSDDWVFPNIDTRKALSNASMLALLKRMKVHSDAVVHGFRSTFRDWAGETTDFPRDIVEMSLGHSVGSSVERAYRRRDALERRRSLMNAWAQFCNSQPT